MFEILRKKRKQKKVSAKEMASLLGLKTPGAYYKKETGLVPTTTEEAEIIAKRLDATVDEIFFTKQVSLKETHK